MSIHQRPALSDLHGRHWHFDRPSNPLLRRECFAFDVPCGRLNQTSPIGALLLGDLGFDGIAKPNSSRHCLDSSCVELLSTEVM